MIQQAEKRQALATAAPAQRQANEGTKEDKKWASAKAIEKTDAEDFVSPAQAKARRERERKAKNVLDIDQRFVEAPERRGEGRGEGRGRGGRGRGEGRGGRGDGFRGGRGRGDGPPRGPPRGGPRGGQSGGAPRGGAAPVAVNDTSAFPALGA